MNNCLFCKKEIEQYLNYCSWECHVEEAKVMGGKSILPNGLPVACITRDGTMLEHEHGDHKDYKFPVQVEYCGSDNTPIDSIGSFETHAFLYTDGTVALTIYECSYAIWSAGTGRLLGGNLWQKNEWRLSESAIEKIRTYNGK